jgi:2-C-methyl-D-erythritol 4-phosphate cytidylyltransferase/2-C-methyl-D-erythritol 2,4-cyclodiphosphate synthase
VAGGAVRSESVLNSLQALAGNAPKKVLVHDAARACITTTMIEAVVAGSSEGAATLAHREPDTLRLVEGGLITGEIDRETIAGLETPQAFPYARILELHKAARGKDQIPDDTTLFTRSGEKVRVVYHDDSNMKITYPEDIFAAEGILYGRGWMDASEGDED